MSQFWKLAILCSVGSIFVVLGVTLNLPVIIQTILLIVGLILSIIGLIMIMKYILTADKK